MLPISLKRNRNLMNESGFRKTWTAISHFFMLTAFFVFSIGTNHFLSQSSSPKKRRTETVEDRDMRSTKARVVTWWNAQHFEHRKDVSHMWLLFPPTTLL